LGARARVDWWKKQRQVDSATHENLQKTTITQKQMAPPELIDRTKLTSFWHMTNLQRMMIIVIINQKN